MSIADNHVEFLLNEFSHLTEAEQSDFLAKLTSAKVAVINVPECFAPDPEKIADAISGVLTRKPSPLAGVKKSDEQMRCRADGCANRSKGPRFKFRCAEHVQ